MEGGLDRTTYAANKNSWVDMKKFFQWFRKRRIFCVNGTVLLWYLSTVGTFPDKTIKEIE
jgi:hypothetical protein